MNVSFGNMKVWMNLYRPSQHPPMEEVDYCVVAMMDELVQEALPYILTEDPLEACLAHFGFDEYDIDHSIEEVNALLGKTTPFTIGIHGMPNLSFYLLSQKSCIAFH